MLLVQNTRKLFLRRLPAVFVASLMACNFHIAQICPVLYCIVLSCPVLSNVQLRVHKRQLAGESRNKAEAAQ